MKLIICSVLFLISFSYMSEFISNRDQLRTILVIVYLSGLLMGWAFGARFEKGHH